MAITKPIVNTTGKAGGLISPKRAALLATLKGYLTLRITPMD